MIASSDESNLVYSPLSAEVAFAMLREGARGTTAAEMDRVLGFPADRSVAYDALLTKLADHDRDVKLEINNGFFIDPGLTVKPSYLVSLKKWYDTGVWQTAFPEPALDDINAYVNKRTHGRIPQLLDELPPEALAALVNTVYLDAAWPTPFNKRDTTASPFTTADGDSKTVQMMHRELEAQYAEAPGWQAVRLPFSEGNLSMTILLPRGGAKPVSLLSPSVLDSVQIGSYDAVVTLSLPRWKLDNTLRLDEVLRAMGLGDLFGTPDLSGISASPLHLAQAVQEANIDVNEEGVVAAAATALLLGGGASEPPAEHVTVNANHPFAYVIQDDDTGLPIFEGVVSDPS